MPNNPNFPHLQLAFQGTYEPKFPAAPHPNAEVDANRTNWNDIARFEVALPPASVAAEFTDLIRPMIDRILANIHESRTLAELRDTLLPKLLSGEINVS